MTLLLDSKLKDSDMRVLVHPMHNFESLEISARDIVSLLISKGIAITFIDCQGSLLLLLPNGNSCCCC